MESSSSFFLDKLFKRPQTFFFGFPAAVTAAVSMESLTADERESFIKYFWRWITTGASLHTIPSSTEQRLNVFVEHHLQLIARNYSNVTVRQYGEGQLFQVWTGGKLKPGDALSDAELSLLGRNHRHMELDYSDRGGQRRFHVGDVRRFTKLHVLLDTGSVVRCFRRAAINNYAVSLRTQPLEPRGGALLKVIFKSPNKISCAYTVFSSERAFGRLDSNEVIADE